MSGMGFMIAASSRKRDDRGRYMEGDQGNRMEGNYGNYSRMGNDHSTHMEAPEMRRRRDSRGRYMEDEDGPRMAYEGNPGSNESAYRPWPEPHMPPYLDKPEGNMRDRNVINIRDYQDKRRIGFGANEGEGTDMRQYGRRYNPDRMHMHKQPSREMEYGYAQEDGKLTREEAEKWVEGMKPEDGKQGARWTFDQVRQYASNLGIQGEEAIEFFAVMNALSSDYGKVARKHGVDKVDFWADMAKAFIHDKDAVPDKVRVYYECIAKHEEE